MEVQTKPFEVTDFSGGITDNYFGGDPRRSAKLHNFIINVDTSISSRDGYRVGLGVAGDGQLPEGNVRVNNLFTVIDEGFLFGQQGRNLAWYNPITGWFPVVGPSGNQAIQDGDELNQTTVAEFQRQFYLASDGGNVAPNGVQPSKVFRDTTNTWVARTAGLPRLYAEPTFNNGTLLAACISLANALQTAFIAHFLDATPGNVYNKSTINNPLTTGYANPNTNTLHAFPDRYSLGYLQTTVYTSADPEINTAAAAPAATDQNSLFTLVGALNNAFSHHISDPAGAWSGVGGQGFYHYWFLFVSPNNSPYFLNYNIPKGPNVLPADPGTPAILPTDTDNSNALLTCASMLNDLYQKYNWHRFAVYTHNPMNDPAVLGKHPVSVGKIGAIGSGLTNVTLDLSAPQVLPDYTDIFNYVNNLKTAWNLHANSRGATGLSGAAYHKSADIPWLGIFSTSNPYWSYLWYVTSNQCLLPNCTDLDSMYLLIFWLRVLYGGYHINDANSNNFIRTSMTTTQGSPSITALTRTDTNTTLTPFPAGSFGYSIWLPGTVSPQNITFGGAGPATLGGNPITSFITTGGAGTATFQRQLSASNTVVIGQYTDSVYHGSWNINANDVNTSSISQEQAAAFLQTSVTTVGTDTKSWLTLANEFFDCFVTHIGGTGNNTAQSHVWNTILQSPQFQNALLPSLPNPFFQPTVSQASYAFYWSDEYTVEANGIEYLTVGNPVFTAAMDIAVSYPVGYSITSQNTAIYPSIQASITRANNLSGLPTLMNDNSSNYNTSNILLNIYRTIDGGTTWFLVAQVKNGTSTYSDTLSDTISSGGSAPLLDKEQLYTTGGVVGFDQAPQSKYVHILAGTAYYGGITDTGQFFPQRVRQSIPFAPDHCPATFFVDLDDEVTGITSVRANVLAMGTKSVNRLQGQFNTLGQGSISFEDISDGIGCLAAKSIVKTEIGCFFAGTDGFYYTDGFQAIKVSLELNKSYAALTQTPEQCQSIFAAYDKVNRRIWWNMKAAPNDVDNSITYVYYLDYGTKPSGVFTTAGNNVASTNHWLPSSMVFWNGLQIRGDSRGYVFQSSPYIKTDPRVDTTTAYTNWATAYIPWEYKSIALPLGSTAQRKWVTKAHVTGKNSGNVAMQINVIRDLNWDGDGIKALRPINYRDNLIWGDPRIIWGNDSCVWNPVGRLDAQRRFPQTSLRSNYIQLQMLPADIAAYSSSNDYPAGANCTVDNVGKTATILTPAGYTDIVWPLDVVDYEIFFDSDGYNQGFLILDVATDVITFQDVHNLAPEIPGNGTGWVIRGTIKNQRPTISSFNLMYAFFGDRHPTYPGEFSNQGVGNLGENPS